MVGMSACTTRRKEFANLEVVQPGSSQEAAMRTQGRHSQA
jgi:hypothetical protein